MERTVVLHMRLWPILGKNRVSIFLCQEAAGTMNVALYLVLTVTPLWTLGLEAPRVTCASSLSPTRAFH